MHGTVFVRSPLFSCRKPSALPTGIGLILEECVWAHETSPARNLCVHFWVSRCSRSGFSDPSETNQGRDGVGAIRSDLHYEPPRSRWRLVCLLLNCVRSCRLG